MKNKNEIYIIGVDHGYGNIKTANCCFPTGVESSDTEPTFKNDLLIYQGHYYQIGVGHKEYAAEKVMDEDYYILTLAAIARELSREQITQCVPGGGTAPVLGGKAAKGIPGISTTKQ